jgi:tellurium resistance protein TerD
VAVNLTKGGRINLAKAAPSLKRVRMGLGWNMKAHDSGHHFDIDASAFILKAGNPNNKLISEAHFVFYNNLASPEGGVKHSGDNRTGEGEGDDESIVIDLVKLPAESVEISFVVTIHEGQTKRQNFGQITDAYIKLYNDESGEVVATYDLDEEFSLETAVQFGSLYRKDGDWNFKAVGAGYTVGLGEFVKQYGGELG